MLPHLKECVSAVQDLNTGLHVWPFTLCSNNEDLILSSCTTATQYRALWKHSFYKVSLWIVLFVVEMAFSSVVIHWRRGPSAEVHGCGPSSKVAHGCSRDVLSLNEKNIHRLFVSATAAASEQKDRWTITTWEVSFLSLSWEMGFRPRWGSRRAVSICQRVTLLFSVKCFNKWKLSWHCQSDLDSLWLWFFSFPFFCLF